MAKRETVTITLTLGQLADLINVMDYCGVQKGYCYGHLTRREENLAEANRKRLVSKLKKHAPPDWNL